MGDFGKTGLTAENDHSELSGVSVCFFGTLFPESAYAGNSTTGLASALMHNDKVRSLVIFSQVGSYLPKSLTSTKVKVLPEWSHNNPLSLFRTALLMLNRSRETDVFLFNVYLTAFGTDSISNGVGLLLPTILAKCSRVRVVVYMHNLLETQDLAQLGYSPPFWQRAAVRILESLLLRSTSVLVPLRSQHEKIAEILRGRCQQIALPFMEPFGLASIAGSRPSTASPPTDGPTRILLLGTWGPQKDLVGVVHALRVAHQRGGQFTVTLTGAANVQFPEHQIEINRISASLGSDWFSVLGKVPEIEVLDQVFGHDLLILPYNATGGYSGAMSIGAYCGIAILAYDLPQLRETAAELGVKPTFVSKNDFESLVKEILSFSSQVQDFRKSRADSPHPDYDARARQAAARVIGIASRTDEY